MEPRDHFGSAVPADAHDPEELRDWCDALDGMLGAWGLQQGRERAVVLLDALLAHARKRTLARRPEPITPYLNTVAIEEHSGRRRQGHEHDDGVRQAARRLD